MLIPQTEITVTRDGAEITRKTVPPGEYLIGREAACEIVVPVDGVSRRHAKLTVNYNELLIEDAGSSNGTFVNGKSVTEVTRLWPNQKIQVGSAVIELRRVKSGSSSDFSLAPTAAAVKRILPDEFLRDKKYDIGGVVAQGGMGAILDAKEATTGRTVAMKVMLDASSPADMVRFITEAKITAQLEHPNVVPVHELSVDEHEQVFYTMKFVKGVTLRKVLENLAEADPETVKRYPLPALLTVFQKVCDAVAFAHSKGVIHRDLKPENIMIGDYGEVLVMDWGLGKRIAESDPHVPEKDGSSAATPSLTGIDTTMAGSIVGTPQYMSPEQAAGDVENLDVRTDIYALGAILYHLLSLRPPLTGDDPYEVVARVREGKIDPLTAPQVAQPPNRKIVKFAVPDSLAAVVRKAMALDRARRYASVPELQKDIAAYQGGFATGAERAGLTKQLVLLLKRHKAVSVSALVALLALAGVSGVFTWRVVRERNRANRALADLKKSAPALFQLAQSEADSQRFESALDKLTAALALDPALPGGLWERTWLLTGLERWDDALAAARTAAQKEPPDSRTVKLLPVLEEFASAPSDQERWKSERSARLLALLQEVKANATLVKLSNRLIKDAKPRQQLVQSKLDAWLGSKVAKSWVTAEGLVHVEGLPKNTVSIEPLRGLPIDELSMDTLPIEDISPLRGMALRYLKISETPVKDISPLRGMPLKSLTMQTCRGVKDLSPLAGMPLEKLSADQCGISDLTPLKGLPLREAALGSNQIIDLRPLAGSSLEYLSLNQNPVNDLTPLHGVPLKVLRIASSVVTDLAPLRGMPLKSLQLPVYDFDLSPLRGMPLYDLDLSYGHPKNLAVLMDVPSLNILRCIDLKESIAVLRHHPGLKWIGGTGTYPALSVDQFWKHYDAEHAGSK